MAYDNIQNIKTAYEREVQKLLDLNALSLPKGHNNICTLVYKPFFESVNLSLKQKGMLIHLLTRGGNERIVLKSIIKICKTLDIDLSTYSRNLTKLEKQNYVKKYVQVVDINAGTLPSVIYVNPINDKTGLPITSNDEEIKLSLDAALKYLNNYSKYMIRLEENPKYSEQELLDDERISNEADINRLENLISADIFIPAYIAFMENPLLTLADKVIYLYLNLRSGEKKFLFESKKKIAENLHISTKTLDISLDNLENYLYIRKFNRYAAGEKKSSDVIYINSYDKFNGLPEINDEVMYYRINKAKEELFKYDKLVENKPCISPEITKEVFDANIKHLLQIDNDISVVAYDSFLSECNYEYKDGLVIVKIPSILSSLKDMYYTNYSEKIKYYTIALLKLEEDVKVTICVK